MPNIIEKVGHSLIQHNQENDRIYLMKMHKQDQLAIHKTLEIIAKEKGYTKIIAKVPLTEKTRFLEHDYSVEAVIPSFYKGTEDGVFMAKYLSAGRQKEKNPKLVASVLSEASKKRQVKREFTLSEGFIYRKALAKDAKVIAEFYKGVFETYPFPIHDHKYILKTMQENVVYFTLWCRSSHKLVAISSSEMDVQSLNVEMTDFGTLTEYQGQGFAAYLLSKMEEEMRCAGIKLAYTIARSVSYGMNITFSKTGYKFAGTLVNNTNISGSIESMNIWYKLL